MKTAAGRLPAMYGRRGDSKVFGELRGGEAQFLPQPGHEFAGRAYAWTVLRRAGGLERSFGFGRGRVAFGLFRSLSAAAWCGFSFRGSALDSFRFSITLLSIDNRLRPAP
jgi:hypothetical protein